MKLNFFCTFLIVFSCVVLTHAADCRVIADQKDPNSLTVQFTNNSYLLLSQPNGGDFDVTTFENRSPSQKSHFLIWRHIYLSQALEILCNKKIRSGSGEKVNGVLAQIEVTRSFNSLFNDSVYAEPLEEMVSTLAIDELEKILGQADIKLSTLIKIRRDDVIKKLIEAIDRALWSQYLNLPKPVTIYIVTAPGARGQKSSHTLEFSLSPTTSYNNFEFTLKYSLRQDIQSNIPVIGEPFVPLRYTINPKAIHSAAPAACPDIIK